MSALFNPISLAIQKALNHLNHRRGLLHHQTTWTELRNITDMAYISVKNWHLWVKVCQREPKMPKMASLAKKIR